MSSVSLPVLGFAAWSGTGKTTLLEALIPRLAATGLRLALVKHSHHALELDRPGKDSHRLREAGARQVLVSSKRRTALIEPRELGLPECLARLAPLAPGLVLVEGYKRAPVPKLELHRPALGQPLLCRSDPRILAVASDTPIAAPVPVLDLNDVDAIAAWVLARLADGSLLAGNG